MSHHIFQALQYSTGHESDDANTALALMSSRSFFRAAPSRTLHLGVSSEMMLLLKHSPTFPFSLNVRFSSASSSSSSQLVLSHDDLVDILQRLYCPRAIVFDDGCLCDVSDETIQFLFSFDDGRLAQTLQYFRFPKSALFQQRKQQGRGGGTAGTEVDGEGRRTCVAVSAACVIKHLLLPRTFSKSSSGGSPTKTTHRGNDAISRYNNNVASWDISDELRAATCTVILSHIIDDPFVAFLYFRGGGLLSVLAGRGAGLLDMNNSNGRDDENVSSKQEEENDNVDDDHDNEPPSPELALKETIVMRSLLLLDVAVDPTRNRDWYTCRFEDVECLLEPLARLIKKASSSKNVITNKIRSASRRATIGKANYILQKLLSPKNVATRQDDDDDHSGDAFEQQERGTTSKSSMTCYLPQQVADSKSGVAAVKAVAEALVLIFETCSSSSSPLLSDTCFAREYYDTCGKLVESLSMTMLLFAMSASCGRGNKKAISNSDIFSCGVEQVFIDTELIHYFVAVLKRPLSRDQYRRGDYDDDTDEDTEDDDVKKSAADDEAKNTNQIEPRFFLSLTRCHNATRSTLTSIVCELLHRHQLHGKITNALLPSRARNNIKKTSSCCPLITVLCANVFDTLAEREYFLCENSLRALARSFGHVSSSVGRWDPSGRQDEVSTWALFDAGSKHLWAEALVSSGAMECMVRFLKQVAATFPHQEKNTTGKRNEQEGDDGDKERNNNSNNTKDNGDDDAPQPVERTLANAFAASSEEGETNNQHHQQQQFVHIEGDDEEDEPEDAGTCGRSGFIGLASPPQQLCDPQTAMQCCEILQMLLFVLQETDSRDDALTRLKKIDGVGETLEQFRAFDFLVACKRRPCCVAHENVVDKIVEIISMFVVEDDK